MLNKLYLKWLSEQENLGGTWYPLPTWLRLYLKSLPNNYARLVYARVLKGVDLSFLAPNELGCQEAVSRIDNTLFGEPIMTYTKTALDYYQLSNHWIETKVPYNGCTVLFATEEGLPGKVGHALIYDNGKLWSNNSVLYKGMPAGTWQQNYTIEQALKKWRDGYKMPPHYFIYRG